MFIKKPIILCIFLFFLISCKNTIFSLVLIIGFIYYQYKYQVLNQCSIFLISFIFILSNINYSFMNDIVLETHQNYVIASIEHEKVVIYTDEIYFFGEKVNVQSEKKEIDSLSNFNIFNFKKYMNKMNIQYYYEDATITKSDSIQRKMYEYIQNYDEDIKNIFLKIFYQFDTNQNIIYSSGMHFSYMNQILSDSFSYLFSSLFLCLFGFLFPFKFSLFRVLSGNFIRLFMHNKSRKEKVGYQYLICLFFFPNCVYSLSFIIPFALQITNLFIKENSLKQIVSKLFLIFILLYNTNSCSLIPILFFQLFNKLNSLYFILAILQFMIPVSVIQYFEIGIKWIESYLLSISIKGHINIILCLMFLYFYFQLLYNHKKNIVPLLILILIVPLQGYLNPFYTITFINVGQGDSILIQAPFQLNNTLIDIPKDKEDTVIDYLHSIGVYQIDQLIFTHSDSDHNGGKESFINQFKVKKIIEDKEDIKIYNQQLFNVNHMISEESNDQSIVLYGNIGNMNVCLMGDASITVEKNIIQEYDITCDILKVGHHGSQTSTDPLFIQTVEPKIAIISVGKNNYYGHPHDSVINTLNKYKVKIFQTSNGAIQIKSFLKLQIIKTSKGEFDIMWME